MQLVFKQIENVSSGSLFPSPKKNECNLIQSLCVFTETEREKEKERESVDVCVNKCNRLIVETRVKFYSTHSFAIALVVQKCSLSHLI